MKTLWASVQGDPVFGRRANGWLTLFRIVMYPHLDRHRLDVDSVAYVASRSSLGAGHPALVRVAG